MNCKVKVRNYRLEPESFEYHSHHGGRGTRLSREVEDPSRAELIWGGEYFFTEAQMLHIIQVCERYKTWMVDDTTFKMMESDIKSYVQTLIAEGHDPTRRTDETHMVTFEDRYYEDYD